MFKSIFLCICVLTISTVYCDGNDWLKDDQTSTPESNSDSSTLETVGEDTTQSLITEETLSTESVTSSTVKPQLNNHGCATRWIGGKKLCWTDCDTSSTSNFWSTWCFTTNSTEIEKGDFVECQSDDNCEQHWKCKSSCGLFSPHWERNSKLEETEPSFDSNKL